MSPFVVLGIPSNSSIEVAEKAWRALRTKHHPDKGGDEKKFKEAKDAWEKIESGYRDSPAGERGDSHFIDEIFGSGWRSRENGWEKPQAPKGTWRDYDINDLLDEMKRANNGADPSWRSANSRSPAGDEEYVAKVSLREAFLGFNMVIPRRKGHLKMPNADSVTIPSGTPNGYRTSYTVSDGSIVHITTRIDTGSFKLRGFSNADNVFSAGLNIGDIELDHEIDAIDLITGTWVTIKDFLSETLKVRVPAGFDPRQRLKIAGKGYSGWDLNKGIDPRRQHMYLKLIPVFNKPADIDKQKIIELYNTVMGMRAKDDAS